MKALDIDFLHRVYRMTGSLWVLGVLFSLGFPRPLPVVFGFSLGVAISLALLRAMEWAVLWAMDPELTRSRRAMTGVSLLKYIVVATIFYFALSSRWFDPPSLAVGLSLTWHVIFLKVMGLLLQEKLKSSEE
jgi:hypothetical protein